MSYSDSFKKFLLKEGALDSERSKNYMFLCGLHTLYDNKIKDILDIKIYMDTDRDLIKKWKIERDVNERGYSMEKVLKQIKFREKDYEEYIIKQKENADIIINFYEENDKLECNLIIQNNNIINKILKELLRLDYEISYGNNNLIFKLKNLDEYNIDNTIFKNNYYSEILYFLNIINKI